MADSTIAVGIISAGSVLTGVLITTGAQICDCQAKSRPFDAVKSATSTTMNNCERRQRLRVCFVAIILMVDWLHGARGTPSAHRDQPLPRDHRCRVGLPPLWHLPTDPAQVGAAL